MWFSDDKFLLKVVLVLGYPLTWLFKVKIHEDVVLNERVVFAINHPHRLDGVFFYGVIRWGFKQQVVMFVHEKYYENVFKKFFVVLTRSIKVSSLNPSASLVEAGFVSGKSFGIYIEGGVTKVKIRARTGAVRLAISSGLRVVPVRMSYGFPCRIVFGKPIIPVGDVRVLTDELSSIIYGLGVV